MKRVIDGLTYNTETATEIGSNGSIMGPDSGDFHAWGETLYRTKKGRYFLHGEGGAMTKYARKVDSNTTSGGAEIIPLSKEEALEWAEQNLDGEIVEAEFGDMIDEA